MAFRITPDIEKKLHAAEDFEFTAPKNDLFGKNGGYFEAAMGTGERPLTEVETSVRKYVPDAADDQGPDFLRLCGTVEDFGGAVLVSAAGTSEIRMRVRYDERTLNDRLGQLRKDLAAEEKAGGDETMRQIRLKEYRFKIDHIEKHLKALNGKKGR